MQTRSRRVEMPNGLSLGLFAVELAFGMNTLLMGSGRYVSFGRPVHCPFRGLLGVHSRYGLHTRAVTNS